MLKHHPIVINTRTAAGNQLKLIQGGTDELILHSPEVDAILDSEGSDYEGAQFLPS